MRVQPRFGQPTAAGDVYLRYIKLDISYCTLFLVAAAYFQLINCHVHAGDPLYPLTRINDTLSGDGHSIIELFPLKVTTAI